MPEPLDRSRRFQLHWGGGTIAEQASHEGEHHRPTVQLLEFDDGAVSLRFCNYSHSGRFSRSPLIVSEPDIEGLRLALEDTPRIKELLERLVG